MGRVGEPDRLLGRVSLGLAQAFGQCLVPGLGLVHGELRVAIDEHMVGDVSLAAPPLAFDAAGGDAVLPQDLAPLDGAPARRLQRGIDRFGARRGFV